MEPLWSARTKGNILPSPYHALQQPQLYILVPYSVYLVKLLMSMMTTMTSCPPQSLRQCLRLLPPPLRTPPQVLPLTYTLSIHCTNRCNIDTLHPLVDLSQAPFLEDEDEAPREDVTRLISSKLLLGWAMLDETCGNPDCSGSVPIMRDKQGQVGITASSYRPLADVLCRSIASSASKSLSTAKCLRVCPLSSRSPPSLLSSRYLLCPRYQCLRHCHLLPPTQRLLFFLPPPDR